MKKTINVISLLILVCGISMMMQSSATMAEKTHAAYAPESSDLYIVFTEEPIGHPSSPYIHILSNVLGSEEAAKGALIYTYTEAFNGFSARLTPYQANLVSRQPEVLQVIRSETLKLHTRNSV